MCCPCTETVKSGMQTTYLQCKSCAFWHASRHSFYSEMDHFPFPACNAPFQVLLLLRYCLVSVGEVFHGNYEQPNQPDRHQRITRRFLVQHDICSQFHLAKVHNQLVVDTFFFCDSWLHHIQYGSQVMCTSRHARGRSSLSNYQHIMGIQSMMMTLCYTLLAHWHCRYLQLYTVSR